MMGFYVEVIHKQTREKKLFPSITKASEFLMKNPDWKKGGIAIE